MVVWLNWDITSLLIYMSCLGTRQQWQNNHGSKSSNFKDELHPCEPLFTKPKIQNLTNIIAWNNCMLVFDNLNSNLTAIFDNLCNPFNKQHSHNSKGTRRYVLNIQKMKTIFYSSKSVQIKLTKAWSYTIDERRITSEDFVKRS